MVLLTGCNTEDMLGQGVLHFEPDKSYDLMFYDQPNFELEVYSLRLVLEDTIRKVVFSDQHVIRKFNPLYLLKSSAIVSFRVIDSQENWYKVVLDERTNLSKWIHQRDVSVESFEMYLMNAYRFRERFGKINVNASPANNSRIVKEGI